MDGWSSEHGIVWRVPYQALRGQVIVRRGPLWTIGRQYALRLRRMPEIAGEAVVLPRWAPAWLALWLWDVLLWHVVWPLVARGIEIGIWNMPECVRATPRTLWDYLWFRPKGRKEKPYRVYMREWDEARAGKGLEE